MEVLRAWEEGFGEAFEALQRRSQKESEDIETLVRDIIKDVQRRGDAALRDYTARYDKVKLSRKKLLVCESEIDEAFKNTSLKDRKTLKLAKERIEAFHQEELSRSWIRGGNGGEITGQVVIPIERVGIYVPGGKAAYPSSVLMNALPARVAGVSEIVMVTPPSREGVNAHTLAVARLCGIKEIYRVGGAQAIAALAYGTGTIPRVDKIVGPGNAFVTVAKRLVAGDVGIDMIAGPSEILVVADQSARPEFIAADLLSQAEHDEEAKVILITTEEELASRVLDEIEFQIESLPRQEILKAAVEKFGCIIVTKDLRRSVDLANAIAPEHLLLSVENPFALLGKVKHAGSVFLGHFSPVAAGDYLAGPNHVLPTSGTARFSSPLGVYDFVKFSSITHLSPARLKELATDIIRLARMEGLEAHARSVERRLESEE
jgi:histidinol dehydrogenase